MARQQELGGGDKFLAAGLRLQLQLLRLRLRLRLLLLLQLLRLLQVRQNGP